MKAAHSLECAALSFRLFTGQARRSSNSRPFNFHPSGLLPAEDRVFRRFRDAKPHNPFSRNLNLLTRGRIATDAGFAIHEHEFAQAVNRERILRFLVRQLDQLIDKLTRGLLRHAGLLREFSQNL